MSEEEHPFLKLLLNTTTLQKKALLKTVTDEQAGSLVEVAYNLKRLADLKGKKLDFVTYLGNRKHSLRYQKAVIRRNVRRVLDLLLSYKAELLEALE